MAVAARAKSRPPVEEDKEINMVLELFGDNRTGCFVQELDCKGAVFQQETMAPIFSCSSLVMMDRRFSKRKNLEP